MKILILKPSSLGDVVHALPVLRLLKLHLPQSRIYWWLESSLVPLLENDPDQEFSYPAIYFDGDSVLIAYNAGAAKGPHLGGLRIRRIALSWFGKTSP